MLDTRAEVQALLGRLEFDSGRSLIKVTACVCLASAVALLPEYEGLSQAARWVLFILVLAAGLWVTEAIPAFAVALVIIALEIGILGRPGGVYATGTHDWEAFVRPWSSPLLWLFFGGLVLAEAAEQTGLDRWFSSRVLGLFGERPPAVLLGVMGVTFLFSMFMSNTATTAMMLAVIAPVVASLGPTDPFGKALLLGVAFAANIGGMGTIIGTPPNAIAAGALAHTQPIGFPMWMALGVPVALCLAGIMWLYLTLAYPCHREAVSLTALSDEDAETRSLPVWKRILVLGVFLATVGLWLTETFHGIPTSVVSFLPISVFAIAGVVGVKEIRELPWDVLLLIAGGLALGVGVSDTGLAQWLVDRLPIAGAGGLVLTLLFAYGAAILSNFMSNTAAANVLIPIALAIGGSAGSAMVVPLALGASAAMCLPIATPPNALAAASGRLSPRDFLIGGLIVGSLAPALATGWCRLVLG